MAPVLDSLWLSGLPDLEFCRLTDAAQLGPSMLVVLFVGLLLRIASLLLFTSKGSDVYVEDEGESFYESRETAQDAVDQHDSKPHLQGTFQPSTGLVRSNPEMPYPFDNDMASGQFLPLHRPTYDKARNKSGRYPYGYHFHGRKRLWEVRMHFKFKQDITENLFFGIELEAYVPLNAGTQRLMGITMAALRKAVGSSLYHSIGDDPKKKPPPHELPVFSMPLWAFDQFIVTPEGEEPPSLTHPEFSEFGQRRNDNRADFIRAITALKLRAGPTYTFAFWGISQFLDQILWEVTGVIPRWPVDFNQFCGKPPVHAVLYTLSSGFPNGNGEEEHRHLQARKNYVFRLAFWSSKKPPGKARLNELLNIEETAPVTARSKQKRSLSSLFQCCAGHRH